MRYVDAPVRPRPAVTSLAWLEEDEPRETVIMGHQRRTISPHHETDTDPNIKSPKWDKDEEDDVSSIAFVVHSVPLDSHA